MSQRHPIQNDAAMLITSVTASRTPYFNDPAIALEACRHLYRVQARIPFFLYGFVMMPDHVHLLVHVPSPHTIGSVMRTFKMGLSFQAGIRPLWQQRFHIRLVTNPSGAREYIHMNPVRAGITENSALYPWSSASGRWDVSPLNI